MVVVIGVARALVLVPVFVLVIIVVVHRAAVLLRQVKRINRQVHVAASEESERLNLEQSPVILLDREMVHERRCTGQEYQKRGQ